MNHDDDRDFCENKYSVIQVDFPTKMSVQCTQTRIKIMLMIAICISTLVEPLLNLGSIASNHHIYCHPHRIPRHYYCHFFLHLDGAASQPGQLSLLLMQIKAPSYCTFPLLFAASPICRRNHPRC